MPPTADPAGALLIELTRRGIQLQVRGDRLRYRPRTAMTPDLAERVKAHKPELLVTLRENDPPPAGPCGDHGRRQPASMPARPDPHFRFTDGPIDFGDICAGWTPAGWAAELRRKADRCDGYRPDIADHYRAWAADIEERLGGAGNMRADSADS